MLCASRFSNRTISGVSKTSDKSEIKAKSHRPYGPLLCARSYITPLHPSAHLVLLLELDAAESPRLRTPESSVVSPTTPPSPVLHLRRDGRLSCPAFLVRNLRCVERTPLLLLLFLFLFHLVSFVLALSFLDGRISEHVPRGAPPVLGLLVFPPEFLVPVILSHCVSDSSPVFEQGTRLGSSSFSLPCEYKLVHLSRRGLRLRV